MRITKHKLFETEVKLEMYKNKNKQKTSKPSSWQWVEVCPWHCQRCLGSCASRVSTPRVRTSPRWSTEGEDRLTWGQKMKKISSSCHWANFRHTLFSSFHLSRTTQTYPRTAGWKRRNMQSPRRGRGRTLPWTLDFWLVKGVWPQGICQPLWPCSCRRWPLRRTVGKHFG